MGKVLFDIERVRSILDAEDIDVLLTCRPENFSYISGVTRPLESGLVREVPGYALLTRDGNAAVIIPWFELTTVQEETSVTDIAPYRQFSESSIDAQNDQQRGGSAEAVLAEKISEFG